MFVFWLFFFPRKNINKFFSFFCCESKVKVYIERAKGCILWWFQKYLFCIKSKTNSFLSRITIYIHHSSILTGQQQHLTLSLYYIIVVVVVLFIFVEMRESSTIDVTSYIRDYFFVHINTSIKSDIFISIFSLLCCFAPYSYWWNVCVSKMETDLFSSSLFSIMSLYTCVTLSYNLMLKLF